MPKKLKNFLSKIFRVVLSRPLAKRKLWLGIVLVFIIFGTTLPLYPAYAFIDALADKIADVIFYVFFYVLLWIGGFIVNVALFILNQVLRTTFIGPSYTGLDNPIINVGWTLVRDLTNIIFIIILVFIGLATALRIGEYEVKKTLPRLLIIMLLINFSPVICGVVVDASNIVMNFFLQKVEGLTNLGRILSAQQSAITQTLKRGSIIAGIPFALVQVVLLVFFDLLASIIILLFAALFAIRYVAIWVLVILSPIAFAAYILPATRRYFSNWRNQLIQWCIIGMIAAFFLYLGNHMMIEAPRMVSVSPTVEGGILDRPTIEMVTVLMPYGIAIAFLWFGLFSSLSSSAMGASAVISFAQKGARAPGAWAKSRAGKAATRRIVGPAAGKTAGLIGTAAKGAERLDKSLGKYKVPLLATKPLKWVTRGLETAAVPSLTEYAAKQRRITKPKGWDQMSIPEKERYIQGLGSGSDQLVLASDMKGEGTFQKSSPDFRESILKAADKLKTDPRYKKEVGDILDALPDKVTKKMKIDFDLSTFSPTEINRDTGRKVIDEEREKIENKIKAIMKEFGLSDENEAAQILHARGLKPKDIAEVSKSSLKTPIFQMAMQKMSSDHLRALQNNFDEETVHAVLDEGRGLNTIKKGSTEQNKIRENNPALVRWAYRSPAGREMLNWEKEWGEEEEAPPRPAAPPAPTPLTPPTPEEEKEEREAEKYRRQFMGREEQKKIRKQRRQKREKEREEREEEYRKRFMGKKEE